MLPEMLMWLVHRPHLNSKGTGCFPLAQGFGNNAWHPLFLINTSRKLKSQRPSRGLYLSI